MSEQEPQPSPNPDKTHRRSVFAGALGLSLVIWAILFTAFYRLSDWSSSSATVAHQQTDSPAIASPAIGPSPATTPLQPGQTIFTEYCAGCHGIDGKGGIGPDLTAASYRYGRDRTALRQSIAQGRPNGMPAFQQLSSQQLEEILHFVLSLK